ncbi:MAG TPA: cytochrome P450 [Saprospiraceae bacterium]
MPAYHYPRSPNRLKGFLKAGQFVKNPFPLLDGALLEFGTTYTFFMGGIEKAVLSIDPKAVRHILQKHHKTYEKSTIVTDLLGKYTGKGLLTSTGEYWLRQRRLIQPGFHKRRIDALESLMRTEVDACMERWSGMTEPFDAYAEMNRLTFRIVARTLFSNSLQEKNLVRLSELISILQAFIIREVRQPYKRWWFKISGQIKQHLELSGEAREVIRHIIRYRQQSGDRPDDLLSMLLDSTYEDTGLGMNEDQLIDECLILFVAGHETSANALSWMIYLLGTHMDEQQRLKTADKSTQVHMISNVIHESMRLYPPAWVVDRVSLEDDHILDYHIPKGTLWLLYIRGMHRHPDYWKEPDEFIPDRWNDPALNKEAYMPFGSGPRMCIGEHFAMMEMQLILTAIVNRFDFRLLSKTISEKPLVTLRPLEPVMISIHKNLL